MSRTWVQIGLVAVLIAVGVAYCADRDRYRDAMNDADRAADVSDSLQQLLGQERARAEAADAIAVQTRMALERALQQQEETRATAELRVQAAEATAALADRQLDSLHVELRETLQEHEVPADVADDFEQLVEVATTALESEREAKLAWRERALSAEDALSAALVRVDALEGSVAARDSVDAVEARLVASLQDEVASLRRAADPPFLKRLTDNVELVGGVLIVGGIAGAVIAGR